MLDNNIPRTSEDYFLDIRPLLDGEVNAALQELIQQPQIIKIAQQMLPAELSKMGLQKVVESIHSIYDFKSRLLAPVVRGIQEKSTFSLTSSGKSNLDRSGKEKYLFISNHRDIILDSAFLNVIMLEVGLSLPRIAIGDNLLIEPWIKTLVRMADAFIVKRHPSIREMLEESKKLSTYIRSTLAYQEESVWLAQSEGRRKNSDDRTQTSVLKMLTLSSSDRNPADALQPLKIVPLAITYEYDPCDYLKAQEMLQKELNPEWKKSPMDDLLNMQTGLLGYKGRVHFAISEPLGNLNVLIEHAKDNKEALQMIADEIDRQIFLNYRFYPCNYVAYDLLYGGSEFKGMYSIKERANFEIYLHDQIAKIKVEGKKDSEYLLNKLLEMYSMPLKNNLLTKKKLR